MKEARARFLRSRRRRLVAGLALIALLLPAGWLGRDLLGGSTGVDPTSVSGLGPNGPVAWGGSRAGLTKVLTYDTPGTVAGVRFRAVAGSPTRYLASLRDSAGTLLGWASTGAADPSGWMTATFPTAVPVKAKAQYSLVYWASPRSLARSSVTGADVAVMFTQAGNTPPPVGPAPTAAPTATATATATAGPSTTGTPTATTTSVAPTAPTGTGATARNCATRPSACGYPDATNTGVPAGSTLKSVPQDVSKGPGWHWDSRGWVTVDGDGAVLENLSFTSNVDVVASNVTLRNIRIVTPGEGFGISLRHTSNVLISDSEISGSDAADGRLMVGIKDIYGDSFGTRILRSEIRFTSTGIQVYRGLIADNFIHDMGYRAGDHVNGTTDNGGVSELLTIRHNTILNRWEQTDAISLFQDFGPQSNRVIADNLLAGGGYTLYGGANPGGSQTSNIRITGNRFSRLYFPRGGSFGPVTAVSLTGPGNIWDGNIWDDTGAPVTP